MCQAAAPDSAPRPGSTLQVFRMPPLWSRRLRKPISGAGSFRLEIHRSSQSLSLLRFLVCRRVHGVQQGRRPVHHDHFLPQNSLNCRQQDTGSYRPTPKERRCAARRVDCECRPRHSRFLAPRRLLAKPLSPTRRRTAFNADAVRRQFGSAPLNASSVPACCRHGIRPSAWPCLCREVRRAQVDDAPTAPPSCPFACFDQCVGDLLCQLHRRVITFFLPQGFNAGVVAGPTHPWAKTAAMRFTSTSTSSKGHRW